MSCTHSSPRASSRWRAVAIGVLAIILKLAGPGPVAAAPDDGWDGAFSLNGTDAQVTASAIAGGDLYVGGSFTNIFGTAANRIARFDGTTWHALGDGVGRPGYGAVSAIAVAGSAVYAGGGFDTVSGVAMYGLARWDGTSWSSLGSGLNGSVTALVMHGTDLYAGGGFTTAGGVTAYHVAKWDGTSWSAVGSFDLNNQVAALAFIGDDLYAAGFFLTGGSTAGFVQKWNGTSWSSVGITNYVSNVETLAVIGSDLYIGGGFSDVSGTPANSVAKWNGTSWSALGSGFDSRVDALAVAGSDLYASGFFGTAGGNPALKIAKWNGSSWSALGAGLSAGYTSGNTLAISGNDVYVGGSFFTAGSVPAYNLAHWDGATWSVVASTPGQGFITTLGYSGITAVTANGTGTIYAGGNFDWAGTLATTGIAQWDGTSWSPLGTGIPNGYYDTVNALALLGGELYAGGSFANAGGVSASGVARWNGSTWSALGSGIVGDVFAFATLGSDLYAGGSFTTAGGVSASNVAKWNGSSWSALGSGTNGAVSALRVIGSDLYAGGAFTTAGGVAVSNIAKWDGSSWSALGSGTDGLVRALAAIGSDLYAGGSFGMAGGVSATVAKWNGSTWSAVGTGIACNCPTVVGGLIAIGNDLYVAGNFESSGGVAASSIAKWNGIAYAPLGSGIPINGIYGSYAVHALAADGPDVVVGMNVTTAGGKPSVQFGIWHNCGNGVVDAGEQCDDGNRANGDCCSDRCQYEAGFGSCADDGNPCTNDQCDGAGGCAHPANSLPCSDGAYCNGFDVCGGGSCMHAGNPCPGPDADADCSESCDESTDSCTAPDPNGSSCNDGTYCNGADHCSAGACSVHAGSPCPGPDGDGNCSESCNEALDSCTAPDPDGSACNDGSFCNGADTCSSGACTVHPGNPCTGGPECAHTCNEASDNCFDPGTTACTSDGNLCTDDHCSGGGACVHTNNTVPCNDGLFCDGADHCSGGGCNNHDGDPCVGGQACGDLCNESAGNCLRPVGALCRAATGTCDVAETCDGISTACPVDGAVPSGTSCDDANACTTGDQCNGSGQCIGTDTCNDCCTAHPAPSCAGFNCHGCVYNYDPSCLTVTWDALCAQIAGLQCANVCQCSAPPVCPGGSSDPADCVNDYLCYSVKTTKGTPKFTPVSGLPLVPYAATSVLKPRDLCAAASIDNESVVNAAVHQETYQGKQLFCCVPPQAQVQDRFGTFSLALKGPDRFFVPTAVGLGSDPSGPPAPSAADTYLCYRAKLASGSFPKGLQVTATDMFETNRRYDVKKPKHLCAPFDTGDGVANLRPNMMCYQVKVAKGEPKHLKLVGQVHAANELWSPEQLDTGKQEEICVPATRLQ